MAVHALRISYESLSCIIHVDATLPAWEVLRALFRLPSNASPRRKPRGDATITLPLFAKDEVPQAGMTLLDLWTGPLVLDEAKFKSTTAQVVCAFTPVGTFALHRASVDTVEDVIKATDPFFRTQVRVEDHIGKELALADTPPSMVFVCSQTSHQVPDLGAANGASLWMA